MAQPDSNEDEEPRSRTRNRSLSFERVTALHTSDLLEDDELGDDIDPVYLATVRVLDDAFQEMGMGRYQVRPRWSDQQLHLFLSALHGYACE